MSIRIGLLVPAPDYPEAYRWAYDFQAAALEAAGLAVEPRVWTDPHCADGVDVVMALVAWGYNLRFAEWLALLDRLEAARVPTLNPAPLLRWNSDKAYLAELAAKGIPTVPTLAFEALDEAALAQARDTFATPDLVIKPPVSAGAEGTYRLAPGDPLPPDAQNRRMLVQPFQKAITTEGELSLLLFNNSYSHAVIKRAKPGDFRVQPHLGGTEEAVEAPPEALALAHRAMAAAPAAAAYARVDMLVDGRGDWQIMELELIEPALWLDKALGSAERFGAAIRVAAEEALGRG